MPAVQGDSAERHATARAGADDTPHAPREPRDDEQVVALSVLGPLRLAVDGVTVEVPGSKRRAVLAMLAMAAPAAISADQLVDAVWPGDAPRSGRAALQSHVSRLRRHLGPHAGRLTGGDAVYRLELGRDELDAARLEDLIRQARSLAPVDPESACGLLLEARALWRGPALAELGEVAPLAAWARSLTEMWIAATDLLVASALESGDAATAVAVATEAAAAEPLREATAVLLVRALAAHGRAAEALRAAHEFRVRLGEETGLEPSSVLVEVEQAVATGALGPASADGAASIGRGDNERRVPLVEETGRRGGRGTGPVIPVPAAPLLGRAAELAGLLRLLEEERLVTVVGPGGVGKTHLSLEAARLAATRHTDSHVLRLAPVTDPGAVPTVLESALGLDAGRGSGDPASRCARRLRPGRQLLVVDCCEHVLDPVRTLVSTLLEACPALTVLATSRERLGLPVEQTCRLAPLPLPETVRWNDPDGSGAVRDVPSVALFLDRARRVRSDLDLTGDGLAAITRVVRSLDGIPLAIELAAGRLSSMALDDLEARLDRALDLLGTGGSGPGTADHDRHRTLRAAVEWSYDLLPPDEQRLFRNLAVFPDGVDLHTAEEVAAGLGIPSDPATALAHLVDASMVEADVSGPTRYRMLDTLRAFGLDRLEAAGESDAAVQRLVAWARNLTAWLLAASLTDDEARADRRLRSELANLRAAWRAAREFGDLDAACDMVLDLTDMIAWRDVTEVLGWARELATDRALSDHPRAGAVLAVAAEAWWFSTGDLDRAEALADRAMAMDEPAGGETYRVARRTMSNIVLFRGRFAEAKVLALEADAGTRWAAEGHTMAALASAYAGDLDEAATHLTRARDEAAAPTIRAFARYAEGEVAALRGRCDEAEAAYREALDQARLTGAAFLEGIALVGLVSTLAASGRTSEALMGYRALLDRWERTGAWIQQWTTVRNLADLLEGVGDHETAATLRRAADRAPEAPPLGPDPGSERHAGDGEPDRDEVLRLAHSAIEQALDRTSPA